MALAPSGGLSHFTLDDGHQPLEVVLRHVVAGAGLHGRHRLLFADRAGHDDERHVEPAVPEQLERRGSAEVRQAVVADYNVPRLPIERGPHGAGGFHAFDDRLEAAAGELADKEARVVLGVLYQQEAERYTHLRASGASAGPGS